MLGAWCSRCSIQHPGKGSSAWPLSAPPVNESRVAGDITVVIPTAPAVLRGRDGSIVPI